MGFPNLRALPHREVVTLKGSTALYCYQEGAMNSALAVMDNVSTVLNVNDAEIRQTDCRLIRRDVGDVSVILNQFGIAGYGGAPDYAERLPRMARRILENIVQNHRDLGARATIPFASLMYFCCDDNNHINQYNNNIRDVAEFFDGQGLLALPLFPGDEIDDQRLDSSLIPATLDRFDRCGYTTLAEPLHRGPLVDLDQLRGSFSQHASHLSAHFPAWLLRAVGKLRVWVPDLDRVVTYSFAPVIFEATRADIEHESIDAIINSQPLECVFRHSFGLQTLGVSGRFILTSPNNRPWQLYRVVCSLDNAQLHLRPHLLLRRQNLEHVRHRARGAASQLRRRVQTLNSG
jgi:hypothetical protein